MPLPSALKLELLDYVPLLCKSPIIVDKHDRPATINYYNRRGTEISFFPPIKQRLSSLALALAVKSLWHLSLVGIVFGNGTFGALRGSHRAPLEKFKRA